ADWYMANAAVAVREPGCYTPNQRGIKPSRRRHEFSQARTRPCRGSDCLLLAALHGRKLVRCAGRRPRGRENADGLARWLWAGARVVRVVPDECLRSSRGIARAAAGRGCEPFRSAERRATWQCLCSTSRLSECARALQNRFGFAASSGVGI